MGTVDDYLEHGASEFEEAYDAPSTEITEHFSAELLEHSLEVLEPPVPVCVEPNAKLRGVIEGMAQRNQGCILVRENGCLVGVFTERDVIRKVVGKVDVDTTEVREVMTPDPEAVSFHDTIAVALNKMTIGGFRRIPLVDIQMRPVGIVSIRDVMAYFVERFPHHILNVSPNPTVRKPDEIAGAG